MDDDEFRLPRVYLVLRVIWFPQTVHVCVLFLLIYLLVNCDIVGRNSGVGVSFGGSGATPKLFAYPSLLCNHLQAASASPPPPPRSLVCRSQRRRVTQELIMYDISSSYRNSQHL